MSVAIVPILNKKVTALPGAPIEIGNGVYFETVSDQFWGQLVSDIAPVQPEFRALLPGSPSRCIRFELGDIIDEKKLQGKISGIGFLLNYMCDGSPVAIRFFAVFEGKKKLKLTKCLPLAWGVDSHSARNQDFSLKRGVKRKSIKDFFAVIDTAIDKKGNISRAMDRLNSALLRVNMDDKIIDLTIAMECLIPGQSDIAFKFSIFHSYISTPILSDRFEVSKLLKKLYSARSKLVHEGNTSNPDVIHISGKFDECVKIAKTCIAYYAFFLAVDEADNWQQHLTRLSLGEAIRVTE